MYIFGCFGINCWSCTVGTHSTHHTCLISKHIIYTYKTVTYQVSPDQICPRGQGTNTTYTLFHTTSHYLPPPHGLYHTHTNRSMFCNQSVPSSYDLAPPPPPPTTLEFYDILKCIRKHKVRSMLHHVTRLFTTHTPHFHHVGM